ncbi:HNH endonuclease [Streptomyces sp. B93]|uniref:HNH endonuclease n=1 Tax=Streptomyces sp. B93 TaxID=2824875 RepID=UPI001B395670|nr:HNH endonuclease [Streptomyces sp. B93]MBQ1094416.1 HNH endonuclease [Streptomyces sp. B93]
MVDERVIGYVEGYGPGSYFTGRRELFDAQLHGDLQRGISRIKDKDGSWVSDAIVLNGGYEDDADDWYSVLYTGASRDKDKYTEGGVTKLKCSQSWDYRDNAALKLSYERGHLVRVVRGYEGEKRYSPGKGYRYDGLYEITDVRTAISKSPAPDGSEIEICQFDLERIPDSLQEVPGVERHTVEAVRREEEERERDTEKFPGVRSSWVQRMVRDSALIRRIKKLYDHECQICGLRLVDPDGKPYSEGAHIKPLGKPHYGPDVEPNVLCLCPNCHVLLDVGAVVIEDDWSIVLQAGLFGVNPRSKLRVHRSHKVHPGYVRDHRERWQSAPTADQPAP